MFFIGDSKTAGGIWTTDLARQVGDSETNVGVSGTTASYWHSHIDAVLATAPAHIDLVPIDLGVNDFGSATQAAWIADMDYVADAVHVKWPNAKVYLAYPWSRNSDTPAATFHGWIDTIIASRPSFVFAGPDEAVWLKGSDNGNTNTADGTHYSAAGYLVAPVQWKAKLGY